MPNPKQHAFFEKMDALGLMLTYNDVRMETDYSEVLPPETNLQSRFSRNIALQIPVVSSAMDTVTEARMAIAMAELGGLGVIHKNMSPEKQVKQVVRVKHHLGGKVDQPITVDAAMTLQAIEDMRVQKRYGFQSFPVMENGIMVGILTGSDFRFAKDGQITAASAMTSIKSALVGTIETTPEEALEAMRRAKKNVMPLLADDSVVGMYVFSDLVRIFSGQSMHNVDQNGHLIAAAAIGAGDEALLRAEMLLAARCDVLVIDTAHGDSKNVISTIKELKARYKSVEVVAGNVSRGESVKRLIDAGVDGVLIGQGPGSICTTRIVAGIGCPQVSAVYDCARAAEGSGVPVCADGGIQHPGDIAIAIAVGAGSVMLGSILAGTDKSPGDIIQSGGRQMKRYRGMGSLGAMLDRAESRARYGQADVAVDKLVPEGIEGVVPYSGPLHDVLNQYVGGLRAAMGYLGQATIEGFQANAEVFRITNAGLTESHPHDIIRN